MDATIIGTVLHGVQKSLPVFKFPEEVTETVEGDSTVYVFKEVSAVITDVVFEGNPQLKTLGAFTFYGCSKISTFDFSKCKKLNKINSHCFSYCTKLLNLSFASDGIFEQLGAYSLQNTIVSEIHFPKSFKTFSGSYIFGKSLRKVTFDPECKISSLGTWVFSESGLNEFTIPKYVTSMAGNSLQGTQLKEFVVHPENKNFNVYEKNLYNSDNTSFVNVAPLATEVDFHPKCCRILSQAFMWTAVTNLIIPSHVYEFHNSAFYFNTNLKTVEIRNGTKLSEMMFCVSPSLTTVTLPSNLEVIGKEAFWNTPKLLYLYVPKSVHTVTDGFSGMNNDVKIDFEDGSPFSFEDSYLYNINKTILHAYFGSSSDIKIKASVTKIDGTVFRGKEEINKVDFEGDSIESLGDGAFENTVNLKSINLPHSITTISRLCFKNSGIVNLTIPSSVTSLGEYAFQVSAVRNVIVENGVKSLSENCFDNCRFLGEITIPRSLTFIPQNCFINSNLSSIKFVDNPDINTTLEIGVSAFQNCKFVFLVLPKWISKISPYSFMGNPIEEAKLASSSIQSAVRGAFKDCTRLKRVYFPKTMTKIENSCFENSGLTLLSIPPNVQTIEPGAFRGCLELERVIIESDSQLQNVGSSSFRGCKSLIQFEATGTTTNYDTIDGVLYGIESDVNVLVAYPPAKQEKKYTVPSKIQCIGAGGFLESELEEIVMEENVREIRSSAFEDCVKLLRLVFENDNIHFDALAMVGVLFRCGLIEVRKESDTYRHMREIAVPPIAFQECPTGGEEYFEVDVIKVFLSLTPMFDCDFESNSIFKSNKDLRMN